MQYEDVQAALEDTGFICRGGFEPGPDDAVPEITGETDAVVIVVGNAGSGMWRHFDSARGAARRQNEQNPLNDWTAEMMRPIAAKLNARVHFPFDRPYHPFQRWAMKADSVWQSPLGPLIHPKYGLWHAYRAALVFEPGFAVPARPPAENPCENCSHRKCLKACPVGAYEAGRYDVPACVEHIATPKGKSCINLHCLARRACPIGRELVYEPPHAEFHMSKFLANAVKRFAVELPKTGTAAPGDDGQRGGE
jgi:ferredoxin